ncbi:MAG: short chain enoyl-CoA hydratase [Hydrocarboniphaga sp.]|uniref:crotonase/enoyl-CoA hydratase family protein n=1 Tax=Hydrocarboniphaga sp. TaxID=2033016 RepID=UPI002638B327|nr:crotonase/enoyl-CoA hydratase family protein [Hydrocarboniphaga sp.]MDB5969169.1 short chain enoyl-CoA hydratase [Hydrocarboniphaga sp.]
MQQEVITSREGGILVVTINRPEAKNAANHAVALGIAAAMDELDADPALRVAVLTGAGGTFCSGMDLKGFITGDRPVIEGRGFCGLTEAQPAKPLIAAVEGYAVGGGFEMAIACDLIVAASSARFGVPEVKRGLMAKAGGLIRLPRQMPSRIAMELALTGDFLSAQRGYELGMVSLVTEPGGALQAALAMAAKIATNGPLAVAASKKLINESQDWSSKEMFHLQLQYTDPVFKSADAQEGAKAFAEKRAPQWQGK